MSEFLKVALEAAQRSEELIMRYFQPGVSLKLKEDETPVTIADTGAEKIIRDVILSKYPSHSILGEEYGGPETQAGYLWILDPIDGTKNYSRTIPIFGTQIALMKDGEIILGVSNMPAMHELMYAEKGAGAFLNGTQVHVSTVSDLKESFFAHGSTLFFQQEGMLDTLVAIAGKTRCYRNFGDCWMYHLVAQGKVDFVIEPKLKVWDIAAAVAIVREAGGIFTDVKGRPITLQTTSSFAGNPAMHKTVSSLLGV